MKNRKYKIKDWIYCLKGGANDTSHKTYKGSTAKEGTVHQIKGFDMESNSMGKQVSVTYDGAVIRTERSASYFRPATQEEIRKAKGIVTPDNYNMY